MPSLAITQPYATRPLDLIDATDRSYRQIESAWASALQIQKAVRDLMNIDPKTGLPTSGSYFMPSSIVNNRAMYEMYVNFLNGVSVGAIAGATDIDGVTFTPTTSLSWPVDGLKGLYHIKSYVAVSYDPTDSSTYLITPIVSNTADALVSEGDLFASADTVELVPKSVFVTDILAAMMSLT